MGVCYHKVLLLFDETGKPQMRRCNAAWCGVSSGATLFANVPNINKNQLTVMCIAINHYPVSKPRNGKQAGHFLAINHYPVSKPRNGKQAGHFLQHGAIYKVFQEL